MRGRPGVENWAATVPDDFKFVTKAPEKLPEKLLFTKLLDGIGELIADLAGPRAVNHRVAYGPA